LLLGVQAKAVMAQAPAQESSSLTLLPLTNRVSRATNQEIQAILE
jgi:hypothetical protein